MTEFFTPARILDIAIAVILLWMVIRYLRSGFLAGLLDFVGSLVSLGGAWWCASKFSPVLFDKLFSDNLVTRTTNVIADLTGKFSAAELLGKVSGFLPQNIIDTFLGDLTTSTIFDLEAPGVAQTIVTEVVQPLVMPVISILVFFVVFVVCRVVIGLLVNALKTLNNVPLVGGANQLLGLLMGVLVGLLYAFLLVCAVWALIVITGGDFDFLTEAAMADSFFYGIFSKLVPFV